MTVSPVDGQVVSREGAQALLVCLACAVADWWRHASPQARRNVAVTDPGLAGLLTEVAERVERVEGVLR